MSFTSGQRVRFTAVFTSANRRVDPSRVTVTAVTSNGERPLAVRSQEAGIFWAETVVQTGTLVVVWRAGSGGEDEESVTRYEVVPAEAVVIPPTAVAEPPPRLDRTAALRRMREAGIEMQDSWSDDKVRAILGGIDESARHRRVHGY